jgi:hypothetical protein
LVRLHALRHLELRVEGTNVTNAEVTHSHRASGNGDVLPLPQHLTLLNLACDNNLCAMLPVPPLQG